MGSKASQPSYLGRRRRLAHDGGMHGDSVKMKLKFGNITKWGPRAWGYIADGLAGADGFAFVESHLNLEDSKSVASKLKQAGWRTRFAKATSTGRSHTGTHGGIVFGQRSHLAGQRAPCMHAREAPPDQWTAHIVRAKGADVLLIFAYMDDSIGFAGNLGRFTQIRELIIGASMPFVLVADFNMEPSELADSRWPHSVGGVIVTPPVDATCSVGGRLIDFAVIHHSLIGSVSLDVDHDAPWKPHLGLDISIHMRPRRIHILQQAVPVALPAPCDAPFEVDWSEAVREARPLIPRVHARLVKPSVPGVLRPQIDGALDVTRMTATFITRVEVYHLLKAGIPAGQRARFVGRGSTPCFAWAPAVRTQAQALARYNWPASRIWAIIGHRMDMIDKLKKRNRGHGQVASMTRRLATESAMKVREACAATMDEVLKLQWAVAATLIASIAEVSGEVWRELRVAVEVWLEYAENQRRSAGTRDFAKWVKQATDNHSKIAHRFARGCKAPAPEEDEIERGDGTHTSCPDEAMRERLKQWSGFWVKGDSRARELDVAMGDLASFRSDHPDHDREAMSAGDWRRAIRCLKADRAKGQDQLQPRDLRNLPHGAFLELEPIGAQMDQRNLPWQSVDNTVALLGKPTGGDRPITIVTLLHAARSKHRGRWTREWDAREHGFWDTAIKGSSALRAGLVRRLLDETCFSLGASTVSVFYDIRKFHDSVNLARLIRWGLELGWNSDDLQFYIAGHLCPRRLKVGGHHSDLILVDGSLMAGCVAANSCAKTVLFALLRDIHAQVPASIQQYVDDLAQRVEGTAADVLAVTVQATCAVVAGLNSEGFAVAQNKCGILGPNRKLCIAVQGKLSAAGIDLPVVNAIRDLGIDAGGGKRRSIAVLKGRVAAAKGRIGRIRMLSRRDKRAGKLFMTNARPAAIWESSASGLSRRMLASLRTDAAKATGVVKVAGACVTTTIALTLGSSNDPAVTVPTSVIQDWLATWKLRPDLRRRLEGAWTVASRALGASPTWHRVAGPLAATIKTLRDIGWDPCAPNLWRQCDGTVHRLADESGHDGQSGKILDAVRDQLEANAWRKASEHYNGGGGERGIDFTRLHAKIRALRKEGSLQLIGLLQHVAAGATWPRARRAECKLPLDDTICPRCNAQVEDEYHRAWECPKNCSQHPDFGPAFRASASLKPRAAMERDMCPIFWLRGLVPKSWTTLPAPPDQLPVFLIGDGHWGSGIFHTDGAGGKWGSDRRRRRCGWGATRIADGTGSFTLGAGAFGGLPGPKQTVPLAELHAAMQVIRLAVGAFEAGGSALGLDIRVDAAYVVKGFLKQRTGIHSYNQQAWLQFWHWRSLYPGPVTVTRIWKSHATELDVAAGCIPPLDLFGNFVADSLADRGARLIQISAEQAARVAKVDGEASLVINRLLAAAACAAEVDKAPPAGWRRVPRTGGRKRITVEERIQQLEARGHLPAIGGTAKQRFVRCARCLGKHGLQSLRLWVAEGPCIDARARPPRPQNVLGVRRRISAKSRPTGPWAGVRQGQAAALGADRPEPVAHMRGAHCSHRLNHFRGVTWCRVCGAWTVKQVRALEQACAGPPARKERLSRLNRGLPPVAGRPWPDAHRGR